MEEVILYTQAYNAKETLQRTIDSVQSQTHTNWRWLIVDNGSNDGTSGIILNAAINDCRIIPFRLNHNDISMFSGFYLQLKRCFPDSYFMHLDADDMIHAECLGEMIRFMKKHRLDVVACGTEFAVEDGDTIDIIRERKPPKDLIIDKKKYGEMFVHYKPFVNELWAKLYRFDVIDSKVFFIKSGFSADSLTVLNIIKNTKRIGVISRILHRAYLDGNSLTNSLRGVVKSDGKTTVQLSYNETQNCSNVNGTYMSYREFLDEFGEISDDNLDYLHAIYIGWIHEKLVMLYLIYSSVNGHGFYKEIMDLLSSDAFREVFTAKAHSNEYFNLEKRKGIIEQMYMFVNMLELNPTSVTFLPKLREKIRVLMDEIPDA